jgi:hypothetical protein
MRPHYERSETSSRPIWFPNGTQVSHHQFGPRPFAFGAVTSAVRTAAPIVPKVVEQVSDQADSSAAASSSTSPMEGLSDPPPVGAENGAAEGLASSETSESRGLASDAASVPSKKQYPTQPPCPRGWRESMFLKPSNSRQ